MNTKIQQQLDSQQYTVFHRDTQKGRLITATLPLLDDKTTERERKKNRKSVFIIQKVFVAIFFSMFVKHYIVK